MHSVKKWEDEEFLEVNGQMDASENAHFQTSGVSVKQFDTAAFELFQEPVEEEDLKPEEREEYLPEKKPEEDVILEEENEEEVPEVTEPSPSFRSPEEIRMEELEIKSVQMLRDTAQQIATLMEEASRQALEIKIQAREEGFQAGHEIGLKTGIEEGIRSARQEFKLECESFFFALSKAAEEVEIEKKLLSRRYVEDLRDLAITVAEKVVSVSLKSSGEVIEKMIETAIETRKSLPSWIHITISEADYNKMLENGVDPESMLAVKAERVRLTVVEEADPGTCLIEFPEEIIDASVSTQIHNIKNLAKQERE